MKNTKELRSELSKVFSQVKTGKMDPTQAKTLVATSNAILKSAQLELEHSKFTKTEKSISFLETEQN